MRRFKLLNSIGAVFDLMRTDAFYHAPDGLGKTRDINSSQAGDFAIVTDDKISLSIPVTGEMIFKGYAQYTEFIDFLTDVVTLSYCPDEQASETAAEEIVDISVSDDILVITGENISVSTNGDVIDITIPDTEVYAQGRCIVIDPKPEPIWYYRDCCIRKITKSEISRQNGSLVCSIEFLPLTPWYKPAVSYFSSADEAEGKKYPYIYPVVYGDDKSGEIEIVNNSKDPAPCKITIYGPCLNPVWSCSQNGVSVAAGSLKAQAAAGEYIVIDANPPTMEIAKYAADGTRTDLYQNSDFSRERFISAPTGQSTFYIAHSGNNTLEAMIEVREYADTV